MMMDEVELRALLEFAADGQAELFGLLHLVTEAGWERNHVRGRRGIVDNGPWPTSRQESEYTEGQPKSAVYPKTSIKKSYRIFSPISLALAVSMWHLSDKISPTTGAPQYCNTSQQR